MNQNTAKPPKGFSMLELAFVVSVMLILFAVAVVTLNPTQLLQRSRDNKRLSDASLLERVIGEYKLDTGTLPDSVDTLRTSTTLPGGQTGPLSNPISGWIVSDLSTYTTRLPIDPTNDSDYFYSYQHDGPGFEIEVRLEFLSDIELNDGGDNNDAYEVGDDLTII